MPSQRDTVEPQQFSQRPGLERTAARDEWWFGVGKFRHVTETGVMKMLHQRREKTRSRLAFGVCRIATDPHPSFHEWADQPRPHGALVGNRHRARARRPILRLLIANLSVVNVIASFLFRKSPTIRLLDAEEAEKDADPFGF